MLIATDFLWVGFSSPKTFNLRCMPPPLSFCAEPNGEVAESILQRITLLFRERRDGRRWWERAGEDHFLTPLIRPDGHLLPQEEGFSSQSAAVDSATSGKPCVQNDISES